MYVARTNSVRGSCRLSDLPDWAILIVRSPFLGKQRELVDERYNTNRSRGRVLWRESLSVLVLVRDLSGTQHRLWP